MEDAHSTPARTGSPWVRRIPVLLLAAIAIVSAVQWARVRKLEGPIYQGISLSRRIGESELISQDDLKAIGPAAITWLIWAAENGRSEASLLSAPQRFLRKVSHRRTKDYNERERAVFYLSVLGPDAAPAIPVLVRLLADPDVRIVQNAAVALVSIGPQAWPSIESAFRDGGTDARKMLVAYAKEQITNVNWPAYVSAEVDVVRNVDFLIRACANPDPAVRYMAAGCLAKVRAQGLDRDAGDAVVARIIAELSDSDSTVRASAAQVIRYFPRWDVEPANPRLIELLEDEDTKVRMAAAECIRRLGTDAISAAGPRLIEMLGRDDAKARVAAAEALAVFGPLAEADAVAPLIALLDDQDVEVRAQAVRALGSVDRAEKRSKTRLEALVKDPNPFVRMQVEQALSNIDPR